jgi:phosphate transport system protein
MSRGDGVESMPGPANRRPGLVAQDDVWREILGLAAAVESMLRQSAQALREGRADLAAAVKAQGSTIGQWEVRIEKDCLRVLALYEPLASDLRRMVSALKLRAELKRVGDLAAKIARRSKRSLRDSASPPIPASLDILARMAITSFEQAVAALNNDDAVAARAVIAGDEEIDRQRRLALKELKDSVQHNPECVTQLLRLINLARNLERIGDHTVNIAEAVVYVEGH